MAQRTVSLNRTKFSALKKENVLLELVPVLVALVKENKKEKEIP